MPRDPASPLSVRYPRNRDLDPQLVWRGKDEQDWSDLVVQAPPLYLQEKVHPQALIDDLRRMPQQGVLQGEEGGAALFAEASAAAPRHGAQIDFQQHPQNWSNRLILGDSLQVMASLAEREGLRRGVQCIYFDPPYGIRFNSNFQWSTNTRAVKDGNAAHITREPEQVKAFRDTWRDGIHSYLTYLRDRLTVARDLLTETGSVFVQIGDENLHLVRALLDEVFGRGNLVSQIVYQTTPYSTSDYLASVCDYILWYARDYPSLKYRPLYKDKSDLQSFSRFNTLVSADRALTRPRTLEEIESGVIPDGWKLFQSVSLVSPGTIRSDQNFSMAGKTYLPPANAHWKTRVEGLERAAKAGRIQPTAGGVRFRGFVDDFPISVTHNVWTDTGGGISSRTDDKRYVVQTSPTVIQRCLLMATDPGDLVLDPTCGSGTTAVVAEQWGRRWITIDTSRVALALSRARIMASRYPAYLPSAAGGFIYERVPHVTLKTIADNAEIDVIWDAWQQEMEPLRERLNILLQKSWLEWDIPRKSDAEWPAAAIETHRAWWSARLRRQQQIDESVVAKADFADLCDRPQEDKSKVRVAGPFAVESLSPHRMLGMDESGELERADSKFDQMILEHLKVAGVQQAHKQDRINFVSLAGWPGKYICAAARYINGMSEQRAAIFIGAEFGSVARSDLVEAAREAHAAGFDVLIACAFNYEAQAGEPDSFGTLPVLKARMNADLHMATDLKATDKGNLFVIFGEPDITVSSAADGQIQVTVNGVDVFDPSSGEVRSDGSEQIACWFIDTHYDGDSFFVRHAYFLGQDDPYKALQAALKAHIDREAWESLCSDTSRPFAKPACGRIAVKVINHLGDEVMRVLRV
jgi:adenine-specific DNA-methyltransferase